MSALDDVILAAWGSDRKLSDEAEKELANLRCRVENLEEALKEAIELIKLWHSMDTAGILSQAEHDLTWNIYRSKAPEMKRITEVLDRK